MLRPKLDLFTKTKTPNPSRTRRLHQKLLTVISLMTLAAILSASVPAKNIQQSSVPVSANNLAFHQPILAAGFWDFFSFLGFGSDGDRKVVPPRPQISDDDAGNEPESSDSFKGIEPVTTDLASPCTSTGVTLNVPGTFSTIQSAINAANANGGDTIQVAAGTYTEQLVVSKCVTITGDSRATTIIKSPASLANSNVAGATTAQSIVEVSGNYYVTMSKLTVTGPVNFTSADNGFGIFVLGGSTLNLSDAAVASIRENPLSGNQRGLAIAAGRTSLNQIGGLILNNVSVTDYQKGGIYVDGQGSTATISNTTVTGAGDSLVTAQNGIQISRGATAAITNSTISGNSYTGTANATATGILIFNAGTIGISDNTLTNNEAGIFNSVSPVPTVLPAFTISGNTLINNSNTTKGGSGIILQGSSGSITNNFITGSNDGIDAYSADNSVVDIHGNSITNSSNVGIFLLNYVTNTPTVNAQFSANFNRISGNGYGAFNYTNSAFNAENNFWGCNEGPNDAAEKCDAAGAAGGTIDFDPYLILSHTVASQSPVGAGGTSTVTTNLRYNSDGTDTFTAANHLPNPIPTTAFSANSPNGIPVTFTATNGTVNPAVTPLVDGLAQTTFTGGTVNGGDQTAVVTARVDNATDTANVTVLDTRPPTVVSANVASSTATTVTYTVTFSEAVTGVDASDFAVTTTAGNVVASVTSVTGTGNTRTVIVTITSGMGTIRLDVVDNDSIVDTANTPNPLGGAGAGNGSFNGQTFNGDVQMPTVTINQATGQADPTSASPINFTVVFSEPVTGFDGSDVSFIGSTADGTLIATVTGSGTTYNVAVSGMTTSGTVIASIPANVALDSSNNGNAASTSTDNSVTYLLARVTRIRDNVTFPTIQSGIDDAGTVNGDTLLASPGVYNEHIVINKSITIQGAQHGVLAKPRNDPNAESTIVVDNSGTFPVTLSADNINFDGFDFDINRTFPTANNGADKPGAIIVGNQIDGAFADGYQNVSILNNRFIYSEANVDTPEDRNRGGISIATADNLLIEGNYLAGFPGQSVIVSDGSNNFIFRNNDTFNSTSSSVSTQGNFRRSGPQLKHNNVTIENNRIDRDDAVLFQVEGGTIRNNTFNGGQLGAGQIYLGGGNSGLNVQNNTFTGIEFQAILVFDPGFGYGNNSNINFIGNNVTRAISDDSDGFSTVDYRGVAGTNQIYGNTLTLAQAAGTTNNPTGYGVRVRGSGSGNFDITGNVFNGGGIVSNTTTPATSGVVLSPNQAATTPATNGGQFSAASVFNINCNSFSGLQNGIIVYDSVNGTPGGLPTGIDVNANGDNFLGNSLFGINNGGTSETIDATNSYWNSPSGPTNAGNPGGTGDAVSANVAYNPFLTSPSMCAPMNTVPGTQTINQDTTLTFSAANGKQISVADPDVLNNPVTVTLSVDNGTLTLSQTTGLTVTGNGTGNVTFSGTLANVNAALNGLKFTPPAGFVGTSTLTITSSSMGSPGVGGGTQTDTDTVTINVLDAVAPTVTINQAPPPQTDPTSTSPINFTVVFSEPVANFATGDVTVTGSAFGPGNTPTAVVTGSGTTYNVAVSGMTRSGIVMASLAAGVASDAQGNPSAASTSDDNTVFYNFVAVNPTNVIQPVNPVNITTQQFAFVDESINGGTASGAFVTGPPTPPLGSGSAQLTVDGEGRISIATNRYAATRLADISSLKYDAYTNRSDGATINLSFDVDYDLSMQTADDSGYQNRLVYIPPTETPNTWQTFDTLAGTFYASGTSNPGITAGCTQATPCTKARLLQLFPNVGILGGTNAIFQGGLYLRLGGFPGGAVANADNLVVGVNGNTTAFDFEAQPPTISIGNATPVTEGTTGQTTAVTFTITQSVASQLATTVTINTADGSATTADSDYQPIVNGTATIAPGATSTTVTVNVNGDTKVEGNETFRVNLSNALNAAIADPQGTGTINNDDVTVSFSSPTYSIGEAGGTATITVTRNGVTANAVTVAYATSNGSATGGAACTTGVDFINTAGTLTFAGNETTMTFTVAICDDNISEPPPSGETVNLTLSNPTGGATLATFATAVLSIIDNDGGGLVTISGNIQMYNAPAANTNLQGVTVTLSGSSSATTTTDQNGNYSFTGLTAGGSYRITPSGLGKIYDPFYRNYSSLTVNITNANFTAYNSISDVPRRVRFGQTTVSPGNQVTVPILLDALGNENGVSFSFTYDTTKLSNPVITRGADAQTATIITNTGTPGTIGVTLVQPSGQTFGAAGTKEIVRVQFTTAANTSANTALTFTNSPITRSVNDVNANPLQAQFINGVIVFAQGLEADVETRPNGDGDVDLGDFNQVGQFAAGLATPDFATTNEFQRADCEPTAQKGDGDVDLGDFIQAGRYAATLDPVQTVGGPAYPTMMQRLSKSIFENEKSSAIPRIVSAANVDGSPGNTVTVGIQINAEANDKGTSFTLDYDATRLSNPQVSLGSGGSGGFLVPNTNNPGKVIVQLAYITGGFQAGVSQIILIQFTVANTAPAGVTPLTFNDTPVQRQVRDTNNTQVAATFTDGSVNILRPTAATATISGRVTTVSRNGIDGTVVTLTDSQGISRSAAVSARGLYRFDEVPTGETYVINFANKRFTGTPQVINLTGNLANFDFTF